MGVVGRTERVQSQAKGQAIAAELPQIHQLYHQYPDQYYGTSPAGITHAQAHLPPAFGRTQRNSIYQRYLRTHTHRCCHRTVELIDRQWANRGSLYHLCLSHTQHEEVG
jgi:hypothetical protein